MLLRNQVITHRGLEPDKENFFSESSFEAFKDHLDRGFGGIEFDPNPTRDGLIVSHDATLERPTLGKDKRIIAELPTAEVLRIPLQNGRISTFDEIVDVIKNSNSTINSLHLKSRLQNQETLEKILDALEKHIEIFNKILIFDTKPETARIIKKKFPILRLAPSVAHPYDIERYGNSIGNTLISVEDAVKYKQEGIYDWVWLDEWDLTDKNGGTKTLYNKDVFETLKNVGYKISLVTPELHGTSPGLYGGESHPDAKDKNTLFKRIKEIINLQPDAICTDYPEEVLSL